ncbi:MAG TPA: hypothetical protein VMU08_04855 [Rhizomicrobium sp.]|nr:hypothetical protein [Rhizomicrobium sp.]
MQFGFGAGVLYVVRTDIAGGAPIRFGAFQDLQLDFTGDIKELYGQNQFALDVARGKVKIEGKAKFAQISAPLANAVYFGGTITAGQTICQYGEVVTVATTATVAHAATFASDLGVYDATTGNPYERETGGASAGLSSGQYSVDSNGTYHFAAGDAGKSVLIDYSYTAVTGWTLQSGNPLMGNTPRFSTTFQQTYGGNTVTVLMPNCVGNKFTMPTKVDDYMIEEFDFQAFAGAGSPVTISTST